jgi:hypothetical protein
MKGSQESLSTVVVKHGPAAPASSSTDGSRPESLATKDGNWTTPVATDTGRTTQYQQGGKALSMQAQNWATPRVHEHMEPPHQWQARNIKKKAENPKLGTLDKPLGTMVMEQKNWATARSGMARGSKFTYDRGKGNIEEQAGASVRGGGKLNPRWVETLMGLPVGWTMPSCASPVTIERMNSDCLGMESCRQQPKGLS